MKGKPSLPSKRALALPEFSYKIRVPQEREREGEKKQKQKKLTRLQSEKNMLFFKSKRKDENVFQATV